MVDETDTPAPGAAVAPGAGAPAGQPDTHPAPVDGQGDPRIPQGDRPLDPEKLLRLAGLVRAVLDEARQIDPDATTAADLSALHRRVTEQVEDALPNALRDELEAIGLDPGGAGGQAAGATAPAGATGQEVRFAYAGLIGWLSGLFQGLQAAMQFQQIQGMNALAQQGAASQPGAGAEPGTGHYL
jgi:hypothetical protein